MALYRGMSVPDHLCAVLPHMAMVDECRESLQILSQQWDLLDVLSRVIETGTEVKRTRSDFRALNRDLIAALGEETLREVVAAISAKAQVAIDIIVRNLFERTADIGFLATDEDLRGFLSGVSNADAETIRDRLIEYQAKYSVYDDIAVMNCEGQVVATARRPIVGSLCADALVAEAFATDQPYVESFCESDLAPGAGRVLSYACKVTQTSEPGSETIGLLALLFGFDSEMQGIFDKLGSENDWTVLTIMDPKGTVLASSDPSQIAVGSRLRVDATRDYQFMRHAGRRYIASARACHGYQGYAGPGWVGCALLPTDCAFERDEADAVDLPEDWYRAIAANRSLFSDAVRDIPIRAHGIQAELDRTVWNGGLAGKDKNSGKTESQQGDPREDDIARQTLLAEISETGSQTSRIFEDAVTALNRTVVGSLLSDASFAASLTLDLMDRNLYERANDCRWWALTSQFRAALTAGVINDRTRNDLTATLRTINDLYTVYTNIVLFDGNGTIVAVSDQEQAHLVGSAMETDLARRIMHVPDTNYYAVSEFAPTELYDGRPTYIYGAPVLHTTIPGRSVGGIAIVFDAAPQFAAMIDDALPRDEAGHPIAGGQALIVDAHGSVIAAHPDGDAAFPAQALPNDLLRLARGETASRVIAHDGMLYAAGASASTGYREYKSAFDAYRNDLVCVCLIALGALQQSRDAELAAPPMPRGLLASARVGAGAVDIATFRIGGSWIAVERGSAVEAVTIDRMVKAPHVAGDVAGYALYGGASIAVLDLSHRFDGGARPTESTLSPTVVILRDGNGGRFGLRVDALGDVFAVDADRFGDPCLGEHGHMIKAVLAPVPDEGGDANADGDSASMVLLLDTERLTRAPVQSHDAADESILAAA